MSVFNCAVVFIALLTFVVAWPQDYFDDTDSLDRTPKHYNMESTKSCKIIDSYMYSVSLIHHDAPCAIKQ